MPALSPGHFEPLHLVDASVPLDPLAALVIEPNSRLLSRQLNHPLLRWRLTLQLDDRQESAVIAWGERTYSAARATMAGGVYRPSDWGTLAGPAAGWKAVASTRAQAQRLVTAGWDREDLLHVPPPGVDSAARRCAVPTRKAIGAAEDDFLWLLTADATRDSGVREAIWAGTVLHVLERGQRRHRLLLWGDEPGHQRARRFVNQLGLPELCLAVTRYPYHALARLADAALLLPKGAASPWSAAVVATAGLPVVINHQPEAQEVLGGRRNVSTAAGVEPREIVRAMLGLSDGAPRLPGDARYSPAVVRARWEEAIATAFTPAASAPKT